MSTSLKPTQQLTIQPGMSLFVQAGPHARLICETGEVQLSQPIMWVGALPVQLKQTLHPGESFSVESHGWLTLQARGDGALLHLESAPQNALVAYLQRGWQALLHSHTPHSTTAIG